jgi:putative addiction module component (TIGR02574 family)
MNKVLRDQVMQLPHDERRKLLDDIWQSLEDEQIIEAKRRLAEHRADPSTAVPWEEVRERLRSRLK